MSTTTTTRTTSTSNITLRSTNNPTSSDLETFLHLLSTSYLTVPLTTAFISEIDNTPPSQTQTQTLTPSRLKSHFELGITAVSKSNILLVFAYGPESPSPIAAALFEPPSFTGIPPSQARKQPGPILSQYRNLAKDMKAKYLSIPDSGPKSYATASAPSQSSAAPSEDPYPADFNKSADVELRPFYHVAFVARDGGGENATDGMEVDAAVRKIVKSVLDRAREEDVAVWLTTSDRVCREEFRGMGFGVRGEVVVGEGRVGGDGWPVEGGEGVKVWGLFWE